MNMNEKHSCSEKTADHLYRIGLFAQMNRITVKALRFYEEQGLLLPAKIDGESGYRYYTMSQMETLHRILALKEAGFTIEDMKHLDASGDERSFLLRKKNAILEKIAQLTLQLSRIDGYLMAGGNSLAAPVMVKTIPETVCAVMRRRIDSYDALFDIMPELGGYMEEAGCVCALPEYCFTQYLEPGFQEAQILVEVCEAVTEKKADRGSLRFRTIPETRAACIYHKGSYRDFPKTYEVILRYIEENGYEICGNIRESYIDGVWNKDSEDEWLSEIQIPVVKKSV
ncbi:MAG: MerR family transcriptional regulator [Candidatus Faecousia sp.]|nr:MerR family transcriptional regulator [Candidatus Faecousia sp.]